MDTLPPPDERTWLIEGLAHLIEERGPETFLDAPILELAAVGAPLAALGRGAAPARLAELTAIYLGHGIVTANSACRAGVRGGGLSTESIAFALAVQTTARGLDATAVRAIERALDAPAAEAFRVARAYCRERPATIALLDLPAGGARAPEPFAVRPATREPRRTPGSPKPRVLRGAAVERTSTHGSEPAGATADRRGTATVPASSPRDTWPASIAAEAADVELGWYPVNLGRPVSPVLSRIDPRAPFATSSLGLAVGAVIALLVGAYLGPLMGVCGCLGVAAGLISARRQRRYVCTGCHAPLARSAHACAHCGGRVPIPR